MKKTMTVAIAPAMLLLASFDAAPAFAQDVNAETQYQQTTPRHDRKIEAAAIEKAAAKIGDLRGSLDGDLIGHLISEDDLNVNRSNQLGFPIIEESSVSQTENTDAIPIV